jgi:hypothetical protein
MGPKAFIARHGPDAAPMPSTPMALQPDADVNRI